MSSGVNTRPVPVSLLRWPRTRDLVTQYKGILMYLWAHPEQTACGCYLLPLDATAADLSMSSPSLADALDEFQRRKLVELDQTTAEIMLGDWFRWYQPRTPAACGAVESAIRKILSTDLRQKTKTAYESIAPAWKGKGKEKEKEKVVAAPGARSAAAAPGIDQKGKTKTFCARQSGIVTWLRQDIQVAEQIEQQHTPDQIGAAVIAVKATGKDPVPGLVARAITRQEQAHEAAQSRAAAEAAYRTALTASTPSSDDEAARERGRQMLGRRRPHQESTP